MGNKYYEVAISVSEYINDAAAPCVFFDTYEEAAAYAKPLVEQDYDIVITAREYGEEREVPYIEIPLDTRKYIENLTSEQAGIVFKNIYSYFFDNAEPKYRDNAIKEATAKMIARIKEYKADGE